MSERNTQRESEPPRRSLFPKLRRRPKTSPAQEAAADQSLDEALEHLAEATRENDEACAKVRGRQSSGHIVKIAPPVEAE